MCVLYVIPVSTAAFHVMSLNVNFLSLNLQMLVLL